MPARSDRRRRVIGRLALIAGVLAAGGLSGYHGRSFIDTPQTFPRPEPSAGGERSAAPASRSPSDEIARRVAEPSSPISSVVDSSSGPPDLRSEPAGHTDRAGPAVPGTDASALPRILGRVTSSDPGFLDFVVVECRLGPGRSSEEKPLESGLFSFAVAPGSYEVSLRAGRTEIASRRVEVLADVRLELAVEPPEPAEELVIAVLGPDDEPLEDAEFTLYYESLPGQGFTRSTRGVRRGRDHTYLRGMEAVEWAIATGRSDARCYLLCEHARHGWALTTIERGNPPTATVRFGRPASLTVRVEGFAGRALEGAVRVCLSEPRPEVDTRFRTERVVDADGVGLFEGIPPGEYELVLLSTSGPWVRGSQVIDRTSVRLMSGDQQVRLACPELHSLELEFAEPSGIHAVEVRRVRGGSDSAVAGLPNPGGRLDFHFLPPGEYEIRVSSETPSSPRIVSIPGPRARFP